MEEVILRTQLKLLGATIEEYELRVIPQLKHELANRKQELKCLYAILERAGVKIKEMKVIQ